MATRTNNNTHYYINPAYLTFVENSGYGANLIQVSASSSCYIRVFIPGVIKYDADGNYRRWKVTAYNNKFPDDTPAQRGKWFIYVRMEKEGTSALIIYDQVERGVHGAPMVEKTDDKGNVTKVEGEYDEEKFPYYYTHIGEVGPTSDAKTDIREISYDTGRLESDQVKAEGTLLNEMWELDKFSTPWLIRAKQWLADFTVKGFITLIGGLIFKKGGEAGDKVILDIKRSFDSNEEYLTDDKGNVLEDETGNPLPNPDFVPVSDETLPTTKWVISQNNDRYLKKYEPDETNHLIKFYDGIECGEYVEGALQAFGGSGTKFDGNGYGEMNGLRLREFLEVPELRFNRIDVVSGILWNSIAFGLIETVDTEKQICTLKLEEGERSGLQEDDICIGMFCNFGDGSSVDGGEDENGFPMIYGFSTCYFTPSAILEDEEGRFVFSYSLQPWTTVHPCASMKFAVYGNFTKTDRQASAYSTRTYKRYLKNVDTWKIDHTKNIYAQYGDLTGLTIGGQTLSGYGSYQDNVYVTGGIFEFTPQQKEELKGEDAYSASLSSYVGVIRQDSEGNYLVSPEDALNVVTLGQNVVSQNQNVITTGERYLLKTTIQAFRGKTELYYSENLGEGMFIASINPVGCSAVLENGTVFVTELAEDQTSSYVGIVVSCEGFATFNLRYEIKLSKDGVGGFVSLVFVRTNEEPSTPVGGTYDNPLPDEILSGRRWFDSVPSGQEQVWMSRCRFFSDGKYPDDAEWSSPAVLTDTSDFEVIYSELEKPETPGPKTDDEWWTPSEGWMDDATPNCIWMATSVKRNGVWGDWDILKIKGEKGDSRLTVQCSSSTVTRNTLGSIDPSSVLVKTLKGSEPADAYLYIFVRKEVPDDNGVKFEYVRLAMGGIEPYGNTWNIEVSAMGDRSYRTIIFAVSQDYIPSPSYPGEFDDEAALNFVQNGADGPMPRNKGEYDNDTLYEYGDEYRDFVWMEDSGSPKVFMRKNRGSTNISMNGYVKGVSPVSVEGFLYWEETNRQSLMAIDTALIDGAWIGGFMIRNKRMESQNEGEPKLVLDGNSGYFKCVDAQVDGDITAGSLAYKVLYADGGVYDLTGCGMVVGWGEFILPSVDNMFSKEIKVFFENWSRTARSCILKSTDGVPIRITDNRGYGKNVLEYGLGSNSSYSIVLVYDSLTKEPYWLVSSGIGGSEGGGISLFVDDEINSESEYPVQNKVIYNKFESLGPFTYNKDSKYWQFNGDLLVTGGLSTFSSGTAFTPSTIMDGINCDGTTIHVNEYNQLEVIGGTGGGGSIDSVLSWSGFSSGSWDGSSDKTILIPSNTSDLKNDSGFVTSSVLDGYAKKDYVTSQGYITSSALDKYATKEYVESGFVKSDDFDLLSRTVESKWTQDDAKLDNWDAAFGWGDHSEAGYAYAEDVAETLKKYAMLDGDNTFTKENNFTGGLKVNGCPIVYVETGSGGYWKFEGDLLVTGGLATFSSDLAFNPSTIMDGINCDGTTIRVNEYKQLEVIGGTGGGGTTVIPEAGYNTKGIASFNSDDFTVSSGMVSLKGASVKIVSSSDSMSETDVLYVIV